MYIIKYVLWLVRVYVPVYVDKGNSVFYRNEYGLHQLQTTFKFAQDSVA